MFDQKTIVITGASDGIGAAAARQLCASGHRVVLVGRSPQKTKALAEELGAPYHLADYAKLDDIVRLAQELRGYDRIDVLANNAGAMMKNERCVTEDGFELTFQVNVLGQYLLTRLLLDKLIACNATVIQTSSIASRLFGRRIDLRDLQNQAAYTATKAYGESKLCNILFTRQLHLRYGDRGLHAVAFQPGISRTNFGSEGPGFFRFMYHSVFRYLFTTPKEKSARRLVRLALGTPEKDFTCGETYTCKRPYDPKFKDDGTAAEVVWNSCEAMLSAIGKL